MNRARVMNSDRIADAAAGITWMTWLATYLAPVQSILQIILTLVGIASGIAAYRYYRSHQRRGP